jgi:hypothetical protein
LETNYNRGKPRGKKDHRIIITAHNKAGEVANPDLHTMKHHDLTGLGQLSRQTAIHRTEMQETSSCRHG